MANGLDAKANGKGTSHSPAAPALEVPEMGHEPADLSGLAVSNFAFAEELYYQYLRDPGSVDAGWRRYFDTLSRENGTGSAPVHGAAGRVQAQHLRGQRRHGVRGGRDRQPHVGATAVRARAATGRGVSRDGAPVRAAGSARARAAPASGDRARRLRAGRRGPRPGVQQRKRRGPRPHDATRPDGPAARDLLPHHRRRAGAPSRRRAARRGCRIAWRARATGWR